MKNLKLSKQKLTKIKNNLLIAFFIFVICINTLFAIGTVLMEK